METLIKKSEINNGKRIFKAIVLLFSILVLSATNASGQNNVKSNATDAEIIKAKEEADHQEFMNYIYMIAGFGLIIGVAWFTVAGKNKKVENTTTDNHQIKKHFHSSDSKKYGTSRARG